jgi:hypothetical protein
VCMCATVRFFCINHRSRSSSMQSTYTRLQQLQKRSRPSNHRKTCSMQVRKHANKGKLAPPCSRVDARPHSPMTPPPSPPQHTHTSHPNTVAPHPTRLALLCGSPSRLSTAHVHSRVVILQALTLCTPTTRRMGFQPARQLTRSEALVLRTASAAH